MLQTVTQAELGILIAFWSIHGLKKEMLKLEMRKAVGFCSSLGKDELQFIAGFEQ